MTIIDTRALYDKNAFAMDQRLVAAIRAGCTAANIHLACSYPDCKCKQMPKAIEVAIRTYDGGQKSP